MSLIRGAGHQVSYRSTKAPDSMRNPGRDAELVAIAGGDGTVARVLKALAGQERPARAAVLPLGTGNNIARSLGYGGGDLRGLVLAWPRSRRLRCGLGSVQVGPERELFIEAAGGGIFADALRRAGLGPEPPDPSEAMARGRRLLADSVAAASVQFWELDADGKDLSGEYVAVEAMNVREFGPNFLLAPGADPFGEWVQLVLVRERDRALLRERISDPGSGPGVETVSASVVRMRPPPGCDFHVDDEVRLQRPQAGPEDAVVIESRAAWIDLLVD